MEQLWVGGEVREAGQAVEQVGAGQEKAVEQVGAGQEVMEGSVGRL